MDVYTILNLLFKMDAMNKMLSRAQYPARPATFHWLIIYFRMIMFYLLPMLAECGRGSISLQSPVTYQVEMDQFKRNFESVTPDLLHIPFDILATAIQTSSQAELLAFFPSSATILLIVWSVNSDATVVLLLPRLVPIH